MGIRHEGAASFAASAYGKLTGGLAACFGIAGPGSTNLLTGLYDAKVEIEDKVNKRKVVDLGPIMLDAERCVMCTRCIRFEEEVTGTNLLQFVNRGNRTEITTFEEGPITHEYAGNLEKNLDAFNADLPPLKDFILPGGSPAGGALSASWCMSVPFARSGIAPPRQPQDKRWAPAARKNRAGGSPLAL